MLGDNKFNPLPRPSYVVTAFGEFSVDAVSHEATDLKTRGLTSKYHEFAHVY